MTLRELKTQYPEQRFGAVIVYREYEFVKYTDTEVKDLGWRLRVPSQLGLNQALDLIDALNFAVDYCQMNK